MIFCIPAHDVFDRSLKLVQTSFHDALKSPRVGIRAFYQLNLSRAQNGLRAFAAVHTYILLGGALKRRVTTFHSDHIDQFKGTVSVISSELAEFVIKVLINSLDITVKDTNVVIHQLQNLIHHQYSKIVPRNHCEYQYS
jgi:hypothetical protein